jgi:hypothetical protein
VQAGIFTTKDGRIASAFIQANFFDTTSRMQGVLRRSRKRLERPDPIATSQSRLIRHGPLGI